MLRPIAFSQSFQRSYFQLGVDEALNGDCTAERNTDFEKLH